MFKANRLSRLATLLENNKAAALGLEFNLSEWTEGKVKTEGPFWNRRKNICHTSACAVGLACLSGEFATDNLMFDASETSIEPCYAGHKSWKAIEAFFGLTETEARHLFHERAYDGATIGHQAELNVAKRIRALIAKKAPSSTKNISKTVKDIKRKALEVANS